MIRSIVTAIVIALIGIGALATSANAATVHRSDWGRVVVRCHNHPHTCEYVTPAIRRALRIGNRPARMFIGDTTVIYVEYSPNHVKKFYS